MPGFRGNKLQSRIKFLVHVPHNIITVVLYEFLLKMSKKRLYLWLQNFNILLQSMIVNTFINLYAVQIEPNHIVFPMIDELQQICSYNSLSIERNIT